MSDFETINLLGGNSHTGATAAPSASSALDTQSAPQTPAQPRRGTTSPFGDNPLGSLAPGMPKVPAPSFGGVLADQYRSILGTAYETARRRMRLGPGGEQKQNPFADAGSVFGQLLGGAKSAAQNGMVQPAQPMQPIQPAQPTQMQNIGAETPKEQATAIPQQPQPRPQIVETRGLFGGRTRSYERNGAVIEVPKSVGTDEASVNRYMDSVNDMVDAMDAAYEDED